MEGTLFFSNIVLFKLNVNHIRVYHNIFIFFSKVKALETELTDINNNMKKMEAAEGLVSNFQEDNFSSPF